MPARALIALEALRDGESRIVTLEVPATPYRSLIVTRTGSSVRVFWNVCQHLPVPLDSGLGDLVEDAQGRWVCQTHGARYRPDDGICVAGPCQGEALATVEAEVVDGVVVVDLD